MYVVHCQQKLATPHTRGRCGAIRRHIGSPDCMRRCGLERLTSAHLRDFSADRSFATPAPKPRKSGDPLWAMLFDDSANLTRTDLNQTDDNNLDQWTDI